MQAEDTVYCEATLNYAGDGERRPVTVTLHDGRAALHELDFESCGFTLLDHSSRVRDWTDGAELGSVHVPEIERLVKDFIGCDHVVVYEPLIRSPASADKTADYAPIFSVHSDFTDDYGRMVHEKGRPYRDFLDPQLAQIGLSREDVEGARRIAMIQFWRNTGPRYPDVPLALCDATTVPRSQLKPIRVPYYRGIHLEFEAFTVRAPNNPDDNRWYTFPGLTPDEVVVLRTYDSQCEKEGRAFWTPHTAFADPRAGESPSRRESVEMRALCLFT